jgi:hypothetical protein
MSFVAIGVGVAGLAITASSAISANKRGNKSLNYQMSADELRAQYERDLSTTQNFEQWAAAQSANYQAFHQSLESKNTMVYAGAAVVVLVAGISLMYLLKKD